MWTEAWPSLLLQNLDSALRDLERLVKQPSADQTDDVTQALARFLVIRTCGYLEQVVDSCCSAYIVSKSSPRIAAYGRSWLRRGASPSPDRLVDLLRRFDQAWAEELSALFEADDEKLKREVSFLVDRRNKIAHGENEGIGMRKALDLMPVAREVADWFILRLDPR